MSAEVVLVVEDDRAVREVLSATLIRAGYRVLTAEEGAEALVRLQDSRVDLVLSDVNMPVLDGYGLYDRVRSRPDWLTLPFVFLTALGEPARIRSAKELGVDDYLVKPVSTEDLLVTIRALLRRRDQLEKGRAAQIDQVKETILATLAHELRTPLTTVSGYAEMLREAARPAEAEGLLALVEGVLRGADRLRRLADDLVTLVELRSGEAYRQYAGRRRPLGPISSLLEAAVRARKAAADGRRVEIRVEVAENLPQVDGDVELLTGALARLLDNAIKFSKAEGGRVTLRARRAGDRLVLEVEDEGVGIAAPELDHIFALFYQVDRRRNEQQGTGSGLTIADAVARMHGGQLEARSRPGIGSTFTLTLPPSSAEGRPS